MSKKPAKKPAGDEEDPTSVLSKNFRRRCEQNGVIPPKSLKDKIELAIENGEPIVQVNNYKRI